jgi:sarcosine oxidase
VGEIMADLAEKEFTRHDISLFRLDRLRRPARQATDHRSSQPTTAGQPAENSDGRPRSFTRMGDIKTFW